MLKPSFKIPKNEISEALVAYKSTFRTIGIFSAIINLLMLAPTLYMLQVYDRVLASRNEMTLYMVSLMLIFAIGIGVTGLSHFLAGFMVAAVLIPIPCRYTR